MTHVTETPGRMRRIGFYLRAMFPLHVHVPIGILVFAGGYATTAAIRGESIRGIAAAWYGALTVFLMALLLRAFDELKDKDADARLFPDRPLVTGAVRYSDIRLLAASCLSLAVILNLGRGVAGPAFAALVACALLTWRWWFVPRMADYPEVVLLTHQPLVPLTFYYIYSVYVDVSGAALVLREGLMVALVMWPPLFAWEIARKVRAPAQETDYLTYSKRWGPRVAAAVVVLSFLTGAALMSMTGPLRGGSFGLLYYGLLALVCSVVVLRFILRPSPGHQSIRIAAEVFAAGYYVAPLLDRAIMLQLR